MVFFAHSRTFSTREGRERFISCSRQRERGVGGTTTRKNKKWYKTCEKYRKIINYDGILIIWTILEEIFFDNFLSYFCYFLTRKNACPDLAGVPFGSFLVHFWVPAILGGPGSGEGEVGCGKNIF